MTDALVAVLSVVLFAAFVALMVVMLRSAGRATRGARRPPDDPQAGVRFTFFGRVTELIGRPPEPPPSPRPPRRPNRRRDS